MSCFLNIPSNMRIENKFRRLQCCSKCGYVSEVIDMHRSDTPRIRPIYKTKCLSCGAVSTIDNTEYDKAEKLLLEKRLDYPIILYPKGEE